jgi:hypothetical protein
LPLGIVESIAQREIYILVSRAIDMKAVGVDLRAGHHQVNLDQILCAAAVRVIRALERNTAVRDPLVETRQMMTQFPRTLLESSGAVDVIERQNDGCSHSAKYRQSSLAPHQGFPSGTEGSPLAGKGIAPRRSIRGGLEGSSARCIGQRQVQLHEVRNRARAHLLHDLGAMDFDGALAQGQIDGDHFVGRAIHDHIHYLPLARG